METKKQDEYKIEIINNIYDEKFEQLKTLIEAFSIEVFLRQKFGSKRKHDYQLTEEEISFLKKDIEERIKFAENSIFFKHTPINTRYYALIHNGKVVAFQTAQIRNIWEQLEGWRNFAYTSKEYMGKTGTVIDTHQDVCHGFLSNIIYEDITKWFQENGITKEKTATGKNMYKNILAYIVYKGFIPEKEDSKRVYLVRDSNDLKDKKELKKIYIKYISEH